MEEQRKSPNDRVNSVEKILGYIILTPPLISVIFFLLSVFCKYERGSNEVVQLGNLSPNWTGKISYAYDEERGGGGGGGYMSAAPIYLGLLAIAGAILVSKSSKNRAGG